MKKVAVVTGSGSGIGRATALRLAGDGYHVVVCDIGEAAALDTVEAIRLAGGSAEAKVLDVADLDAVRACARGLASQPGSVDAFVACAGFVDGARKFEEVDDLSFDRMIDVHVRGHYFLIQGLVPKMKANGTGSIVLTSSRFAFQGSRSMSHYTLAKGAILSLSKALAVELGPHGIRVNAVAPGLIRTAMTAASVAGYEDIFEARAAIAPLRRLATAEEVAASICFLVGPDASAITGHVLSPSGGEHLDMTYDSRN